MATSDQVKNLNSVSTKPAAAHYRTININLRLALTTAISIQLPSPKAANLIGDGLIKPYIVWCGRHRGQMTFMRQVEARANDPKFKMLVNVERDELRQLLMQAIEQVGRFKNLRGTLQIGYIESLVLGQVKLIVEDAVRGAADFLEIEKRGGKFAENVLKSLSDFR